ncbi:MAG: PD-(D/E)XK nuclease family protein [Blastocatellia bacterium]|nr:PD-(D/E)XK nuclease family protein [Blastocatellia bacterium]
MPRVLLLGPILNRNRDGIVDRCRGMLAAGMGHEFLYLAATRPMLDAVTTRLLDGLPGVLAPPNVFLLSGFSRRLVAEARDEDTGVSLPSFAAVDTDQRPVQRPLMARVVARLAESGQLPAFAPLARTDGLVDAMVRLVAEIQRAGKSAAEFREAIGRHADLLRESSPSSQSLPAGRDYDADVATVYEHFERLLVENRLTDGNTDSLRALAVTRGELDGRRVTVPFLAGVKLLVLDGFFDLLPVHQELVTSLVRLIPDVVVNLNHDEENPRAFAAHAEVIERFSKLPDLEIQRSTETLEVAEELVGLRRFLFADEDRIAGSREAATEPGFLPDLDDAAMNSRIVELTASDRLREVRGVAKEIKRSAIDDGVAPNAVAVVVRHRDVYEPIVREVFADEGVPLAVGERRAVLDLPAVRAAMKVLDAAVANRSHSGREIGVRHLVALAKSDYLGIDTQLAPADSSGADRSSRPYATQPSLPWDTPSLNSDSADGASRFETQGPDGSTLTSDELENVAAHVGGELHLGKWLARATYLIGADVAEAAGVSSDPCAQLGEPSDPSDDRDENFGEAGDGDESSGVASDSESSPAERSDGARKRPRLDMPVAMLRRAVGLMTALGDAVLTIPHHAPVTVMAAAFRTSLDRLGFRQRLVRSARRSIGSRNALARAAVDLRAAESLDRAVDAVVEAVTCTATVAGASDEISRKDFRADLERALAANSAALTSDIPGGVQLLGVTDTRGLAFDTVFVLGLVEGEFPDRARGDWIYPQADRSVYRNQLGLPLEDLSPERSLESEEHAFYQAVCRATRRLYLCRPVTIDDGDTIASPFLDDVKRAAGGLTKLTVPSGVDGSALTTASTPAELVRSVLRSGAEASGDRAVVTALTALARSGDTPMLSRDAERRIEVEFRRENSGFDVFDGLLARADLRGLVRSAYAERHFSATDFRDYGSCAFRFFARDVLGLEPRSDAALDLQSLDTGNLLHGVLQRFFAKHATTDLTTALRATLVADLETCANEVFGEFERRIPPLNERVWQIERRTLGLKLERFLDAEIALQERLSEHRAVARRVEVAFGIGRRDGDPSSVDEPLELRGHGRSIRVVGRIDRIDRSKDGSLVAYDYKTGSGPGLKDMEEGRDFQLGIYVEAIAQRFAAENEVTVGGAYLTLKDVSNRVSGLLASDETPPGAALFGKRSSRLDSADFERVRGRIVENIRDCVERIEDGDFRVAPSGSGRICDYCDYRSVCRVEPYRIRRKLKADRVPHVLPLPKPRREGEV